MSFDYKEKYLKYKNKYLQLKIQIAAGQKIPVKDTYYVGKGIELNGDKYRINIRDLLWDGDKKNKEGMFLIDNRKISSFEKINVLGIKTIADDNVTINLGEASIDFVKESIDKWEKFRNDFFEKNETLYTKKIKKLFEKHLAVSPRPKDIDEAKLYLKRNGITLNSVKKIFGYYYDDGTMKPNNPVGLFFPLPNIANENNYIKFMPFFNKNFFNDGNVGDSDNEFKEFRKEYLTRKVSLTDDESKEAKNLSLTNFFKAKIGGFYINYDSNLKPKIEPFFKEINNKPKGYPFRDADGTGIFYLFDNKYVWSYSELHGKDEGVVIKHYSSFNYKKELKKEIVLKWKEFFDKKLLFDNKIKLYGEHKWGDYGDKAWEILNYGIDISETDKNGHFNILKYNFPLKFKNKEILDKTYNALKNVPNWENSSQLLMQIWTRIYSANRKIHFNDEKNGESFWKNLFNLLHNDIKFPYNARLGADFEKYLKDTNMTKEIYENLLVKFKLTDRTHKGPRYDGKIVWKNYILIQLNDYLEEIHGWKAQSNPLGSVKKKFLFKPPKKKR